MASKDRRTAKTTRAICQEVLTQMQVKKYRQLTVSGICEALDISRRTFYLHYTCMEDVFKQIFEEINAPLYDSFEAVIKQYAERDDDIRMIRDIFQLINETILCNRDYLTRIAIEPSYSAILMMHVNLMKNMIMQYMKQTRLESRLRKVYLDYYVSGILELYFQWYRDASSMTLDEIRDFACSIIKADIEGFSPSAGC